MAFILQIETATACCSIALAADGVVLAVKEINERNVHAAVINLYIDTLMSSTNTKYNDLAAVAISAGPGSYTGLRIGVSTAKGLCYALDIPLIAVETLEAMAFGLIESGRCPSDQNLLLCPMIDARRMEVFTAVFNAKGERVKPTSAEIIDADSFTDLLKGNKILFFGDGSEKCRDVFANNTNAGFIGGFVNSAVYLTKSADKKFIGKEFEDVAYFEPYYLKEFVAGKK
jgi:tRNA threonylcarbamoyladenosine biosynthesis protein TsaB